MKISCKVHILHAGTRLDDRYPSTADVQQLADRIGGAQHPAQLVQVPVHQPLLLCCEACSVGDSFKGGKTR